MRLERCTILKGRSLGNWFVIGPMNASNIIIDALQPLGGCGVNNTIFAVLFFLVGQTVEAVAQSTTFPSDCVSHVKSCESVIIRCNHFPEGWTLDLQNISGIKIKLRSALMQAGSTAILGSCDLRGSLHGQSFIKICAAKGHETNCSDMLEIAVGISDDQHGRLSCNSSKRKVVLPPILLE